EAGDTASCFYGAAGVGKTRVMQSALARCEGALDFLDVISGPGSVEELLAGFAGALRSPNADVPEDRADLALTIATQLVDSHRPWRERLRALVGYAQSEKKQ